MLVGNMAWWLGSPAKPAAFLPAKSHHFLQQQQQMCQPVLLQCCHLRCELEAAEVSERLMGEPGWERHGGALYFNFNFILLRGRRDRVRGFKGQAGAGTLAKGQVGEMGRRLSYN